MGGQESVMIALTGGVAVRGIRGTFTYQVCNAGTSTCSSQITVTF